MNFLKLDKQTMGFSGGSDRKESAYNAGDLGLIPESRRSPGEGHGYPLQYSFHGQRSLAGYSPWGRKELHITEQLALSNRPQSKIQLQ